MAFDILGAIGAIGSLLGSTSSSKAASSAAKSQKEAMALQKEWLDRIWKYYEPQLQRSQAIQGLLDPYRNQASGWLASMTGMKTAPQLPGATPVAAPVAAPAPSASQPPPSWAGGYPSGWAGALKRRPLPAPTTGPAAGIGGAPSTTRRSPWDTPSRSLLPLPKSSPILPWKPPKAQPVPSVPAPVTTPVPAPVTTPVPAPVTTPLPAPVTTPAAPITTMPLPPLPQPGVPAPAPVTALGSTTEQQQAIAAAKPTGENAPPWYFQVPELSARLQQALTGTPNWQTPFTPEQQAAMTNLSDVGIGDQYQQRNRAIQQMLAGRGLAPVGGTSSMDVSSQVGLQNWLQKQQANQRGQMALAGMARGDQLRSENLGNLVNQMQLEAQQRGEGRLDYNTLLSFLTGQAAAQPDASVLYPGASGYSSMAGQYGNMAGTYGQMAGQGMQGFAELLALLQGNKG